MRANQEMRPRVDTLDYGCREEAETTELLFSLVPKSSRRTNAVAPPVRLPVILDKAQLARVLIGSKASKAQPCPGSSPVPRLNVLVLEQRWRSHRRARALVWGSRIFLAAVLALGALVAAKPTARDAIQAAWETSVARLMK
jgi:hypothetical protein